MLSVRFSEGHRLEEDGQIEIPLEDEGKLMTTLCRVVHLQHSEVPDALSLSQLWQVAKLVDKYDMGTAIRPTAECWLRKALGKASEAERECLLVCAFRLGHKEVFRSVSESIVLKTSTAISGAGLAAFPEEVPDVFCAIFGKIRRVLQSQRRLMQVDDLEKQRSSAMRSIAGRIELVIEGEARNRARHGGLCTQECSYAEHRLQVLLDHFFAQKLWPTRQREARPLETLLQQMLNAGSTWPSVQTGAISRKCASRKGCVSNHARLFSALHTDISVTAQALRRRFAFACYECACEGLVDRTKCAHSLEPA